jgi:hypothetical protein
VVGGGDSMSSGEGGEPQSWPTGDARGAERDGTPARGKGEASGRVTVGPIMPQVAGVAVVCARETLLNCLNRMRMLKLLSELG